MFNLKTIFFSILCVCLIAAGFVKPPNLGNKMAQTQVQRFQEEFQRQSNLLQEQLEQINSQEIKQSFSRLTQSLESNDHEVFSYFLFQNNKLSQWTDDAVAFETEQMLSEDPIIQLGNAWYYKQKRVSGEKVLVGLLLIQYQFVHQNEFLKNEFQEELQFSRIIGLSLKSEYNQPIYDLEKKALFYLQLKKEDQYPLNLAHIQAMLCFLGFLLLIIGIYKKFGSSSGLIALLVLLVGLSFFLPITWQELPLFEPNWYAVSKRTFSLGDFLLHGLGFFFGAYFLQDMLKKRKESWIFIALSLLAVLLSIWSVDMIQLSVKNSSINFNLNNLFDLNYLSILCLANFGILLFANLILIRILLNSHFKARQTGLLLFFGSLTFHLLQLFPDLNFYAYYWINIAFWLMVFMRKSNKSTAGVLSILVLLSALTAIQIIESAQIRESQKRQILIQKLAEEKDPLAEYLFSQFSHELANDTMASRLAQSDVIAMENYLRNKYFSGYWKKYKLTFISCTSQDSVYVNPGNFQVSCINYYLDRIHFETQSMRTNNLYQLRNFAGRIDYIAQLEFNDFKEPLVLFVEMSSNLFNQNEGYPELLIDEKSRPASLDLRAYSYAVYDNFDLIMKSGDYNYSIHSKMPELAENSFYKYHSEKHEHLLYQKNQNTSLILSKKLEGNYEFFTSLAYLLVIFSLLYLLFSFLLPNFPYRFRLLYNDFSSRIQFFLISSLLVALVLFSVGTSYYIKKQNQEKNFKNIAEKIRSVNIEMENKIGGESHLSDSVNTYISSLLVKFSNVFYTDINLYDTSGILYASSRPEIFLKGLKGNRLNPMAYKGLLLEDKAEWLQEERIGEMNYLSAYIPFKNDRNEVLAYLNLPYFAKHDQLEQEISSFLVSTINIYVGIFALALLVSILLINQLSRPLLMIRKQLASIKLGAKLELIEWNSEDEIGSLVKEYNRMIVELSDSADRLAQSEREGAWREMAKQVAHEIKNPLTPMKLSIQHLQMAYEQGAEGLDEKVKRTSQTLVEQIETLSNIATEFSNFAKMPAQQLVEVELVATLKSAADLYSFRDRAQIQLHSDVEMAYIKADRDQLIRLFNNLIKNSIQAADAERELNVFISLTDKEAFFEVKIEDTGIGIHAEQLDRIFEPNFTTKTGGTGLGLAMAKNIMENIGGSISIKSERGAGTTFQLHFPKLQQLA